MNLEQSNSFLEEEAKRAKKKKFVLACMGLCLFLIIALLVFIVAIQLKDAQMLKMFINGTEVSIPSTLYKQIDETTYVNIEQISKMLGYEYEKGEYKKYNEDESSCYLTNDFEIVAITANQKNFTKYTKALTEEKKEIAQIPISLKTSNETAQKYNLNKEIKFMEEGIYVPFEAIVDMLNVKLNLSQENRIIINTLEQVITNAKGIIAKQYSALSGDYENLKAMIYGYAVVGDGKNYGVISLTDETEIVGIKYSEITFVQNLQKFLIETSNSMGVVSSDGTTIIKPTEYDWVSVYDDEKQLFLVKKEQKYGILDRLGNVIIYPDYEHIGFTFLETEYKILFDKCIPVREGDKYGLYNLEGKEILPCLYSDLGSVITTETLVEVNGNEKPILTIPKELGVKGIVINENGLYGLFDVVSEKIIIPCACTNAYSITKAAKTKYYVESSGMKYDLEEYLEVNNLKNITTEEVEEDVENESTIETSTEETTQTEEIFSSEITNPTETPSEITTSTL